MKKIDFWRERFEDAVAKRATIDEKARRRYELYNGTNQVRDRRTGKMSSKPAYNFKNICHELVETQINNAVPQPKVTPRDTSKIDAALEIEGYLKSEMDRLDAESINDAAERDTYIQGTTWYLVEWDNFKSTPTTQGELSISHLPFLSVYPQPGVTDYKKLEYIFVKEIASIAKLEKMYKVKNIPELGTYKGMCQLVTAYYYNEDGYLSKFGWVEDKVIFDEDYYELRKFKFCTKCGERFGNDNECEKCGNTKFEYKPVLEETSPEDIVKVVDGQPTVLVKKGNKLPYYKIKALPIIMRKNISKIDDLYGVSDIDKLEEDQEGLNKLHTKMEENVLKGGSIVTIPTGVNLPDTDETLKIIKVKDPNQMKSFSVNNVQASIQQEDILQDRFYQFARSSLGITDAYQGKRDPTAESGKAKEISAAQASGRLESKRRMKDSAYADIYEMMFKFLLAYCDESRKFAEMTPDGNYEQGSFSRYNYLDGEPGDVYYNDRFLFSVDTASVLSTNREAMWKETTANFQAGTFGNPADPQTLALYWNTMKELGYPLAKQALSSLSQRAKQMPYEMQQAIMQNPQILQAVQQQLSGGGENNVPNKE